jgi:hypothetical protein
MHHRLYQVRSNSETLLRVRTQGKKCFFHTVAAEMSSSHVAGHIQDDTDLTHFESRLITPLRLYSTGLRQWISIATLNGLGGHSWMFASHGVDYEYARASFPKRPAALPTC